MSLLPDTTTCCQIRALDAPDLSKAFKTAGISFSVLNAQSSTTKQVSQAQQCITNGAKVILVDALDSGTGATIEDAAQAGVKTIDYDRLVLKGKASYYVSFNNVAVGVLQGKGLVAALKAKGMYAKYPVVAELNGAPTDDNATLFAQGYNSILNQRGRRHDPARCDRRGGDRRRQPLRRPWSPQSSGAGIARDRDDRERHRPRRLQRLDAIHHHRWDPARGCHARHALPPADGGRGPVGGLPAGDDGPDLPIHRSADAGPVTVGLPSEMRGHSPEGMTRQR